MSQWQGQRLVDNLYNIDLMVRLLTHLNGCEDPKVKRLLEMNLQWAAASAREAVDHDPRLASPYVAVNFVRSVRQAIVYVTDHSMEKLPPAPDQASQPDIRQNLQVIEAWLQKQP